MTTSRVEQAAIARLTQMGALLTTWSPLGAELLYDFARPEGAGLIQIYSEHQGDMRAVEDNFNTARRHWKDADRSATKL